MTTTKKKTVDDDDDDDTDVGDVELQPPTTSWNSLSCWRARRYFRDFQMRNWRREH